jgi:hypothetical protein
MDPLSFVGAGLLCAAGYAIAYRRRGRVGFVRMGSLVGVVYARARPDEVFDTIASIGPPYHVDDADRDRAMLVLSSRPSIWSYGFFYPVNVLDDGNGGTRVEIGVRSRFFHIGPGMGRAHRWCTEAIARLLTVPPARLLEPAKDRS